MQDSNDIIPSKNTLFKEWQKVFGRPAPSGCHLNLLHQVIGWHTQAKKQGGLTVAERKQLSGGTSSSIPLPTIGSRLIRVWQGETHQVSIVQDGFIYKDQHWKSLSAIAKAITGTPWSGPVFFGVKRS